MNLTKALKEKKKLVATANKEFAKFQKYNSHKTGESTPFDPEACYNKWIELTNKLIDLKSKIQIANQPIYHKIFRMGELKNMISQFKRIDTQAGDVEKSAGFGKEDKIVQMSAFINVIDQEEQIDKWEEEIETLQSEIEEFNAITKI